MNRTQQKLLDRLDKVDTELLELWVNDEGDISDEHKWEIFVVMLERRVEILKTCKAAGMNLSKEQFCPKWLMRLTHSRKELRLREIKILYDELKRQRKIAKFRKAGRTLENDTI